MLERFNEHRYCRSSRRSYLPQGSGRRRQKGTVPFPHRFNERFDERGYCRCGCLSYPSQGFSSLRRDTPSLMP
jgi:hypothetical protein